MRLLKILGLSIAVSTISGAATGAGGDTLPDTKVPSAFLRATFFNQDINRTPPGGKQIRFGGWYRQMVDYSRMSDPYGEMTNGIYNDANDKVLFIGDDNEMPNARFRMDVSTEGGAGYGTEIAVFTPWNGTADAFGNGDGRAIISNQGVNVYGMWGTSIGNYGIRAGGQYWYELTPLTLSSSGQSAFNRASLFQRNPFEGVSKDVDKKFSGYYDGGEYSADFRWNYRPFTGIILGGWDMPLGLGMEAFYGKSMFNPGQLTQTPNIMRGGRLTKTVGSSVPVKIGVTLVDNISYLDSVYVNDTETRNTITTFDFDGKTNGIKFFGEIGFGNFIGSADSVFITQNPNDVNYYVNQDGDSARGTVNYGFGEAIRVGIHTPKQLTKIPLQLDLWRIAPTFVNPNGIVNNSSMPEAYDFGANDNAGVAAAGNNVVQLRGTSLQEIGQLSSNRQGVNLNTKFDINGVKGGVNWSMSTEIDANRSMPSISFGHRVNGLQLRNLNRWSLEYPTNRGPYGRLNMFYRGYAENIQLTDTLNNGWYSGRKNFSNLEGSLKYYLTPGGRDLYIFYNVVMMSVQDKASPIPVFGEKALVNHSYNELELFYTVSDRMVLSMYLGGEKNTGNSKTVLNYNNGQNFVQYYDAYAAAVPANRTIVDEGTVITPEYADWVANDFDIADQIQLESLQNGDGAGILDDATDDLILQNAVAHAKENFDGHQEAFWSRPSQAAINQLAWAIGVGMDLNLSETSALYIRHRFFGFNDQNYILEKSRGQETSVELKVYF